MPRKPESLTDILHNELTLGGVRPSGVIATTFTNKAATELRERVREHLMAQGNFLLANTVAQARIGTVNSVCGQIISRFSFEAGVSTEQRVIEEAAAKPLLERAMDAVLSESQIKDVWSLVRRLGLEDSWTEALQALVNQLRSNDVNLNRVQEFAQRNANDLLSYFPAPTSQNLDADLLREIRLALPAIEATVLSGGKKNSREYRDLIVSFARSLERKAARWSEWAKVAKALPEKSLHPVAEQIGDLAGRFAEHPGLHNDVREYLRVMFTLAADGVGGGQELLQRSRNVRIGITTLPEVAAQEICFDGAVIVAFAPLTQVIVPKAIRATCIGKQSGNTVLRLALRSGLFRHGFPPSQSICGVEGGGYLVGRGDASAFRPWRAPSG